MFLFILEKGRFEEHFLDFLPITAVAGKRWGPIQATRQSSGIQFIGTTIMQRAHEIKQIQNHAKPKNMTGNINKSFVCL